MQGFLFYSACALICVAIQLIQNQHREVLKKKELKNAERN